MASKNTSDIIEAYIKQLLEQSGMIEVKRSHIADTFQVVPSQINYVLKTRFTESRGYSVESKRGGGGYIRIVRLRYSDQHQMLDNLMASIGEKISEQVFVDIIAYLYEEGIISQREGRLINSLASDQTLGEGAPQLRATMLRTILLQLDRKG